MNRFVLFGAVVALAPMAVAGVDTAIFSNSAGPNHRLNTNFDVPSLFQIQVAGGGQLSSIRVGATQGPSFFDPNPPPVSETGTLYIWADAGGTPDADNNLFPDRNLMILQKEFTTSLLSVNQIEFIDVDVLDDGVVIPNNAVLWIGVSYEDRISTLTSVEEVGSIFDTTEYFATGFGFDSNPWGGFDGGDEAPIFDMHIVPGPGGASLLAAGALLAARRRRRC